MLDTRFAGVWNTGFCSLERCKSLLNIWAQKPKKRPSLPLQLWLSALAWLWQLWQLWQLHSPCLIAVPAYFSSSHWGIDMPCSKISKIHWIFIGYSLDMQVLSKKNFNLLGAMKKKNGNGWCVFSCLVALIWSAPATVLIFIHLCSFRLSPIFAEFPWISTFQLWGKGSKFWMKAHVWEVQCSCCLASGAMRSLSIGYLYKMIEAKQQAWWPRA